MALLHLLPRPPVLTSSPITNLAGADALYESGSDCHPIIELFDGALRKRYGGLPRLAAAGAATFKGKRKLARKVRDVVDLDKDAPGRVRALGALAAASEKAIRVKAEVNQVREASVRGFAWALQRAPATRSACTPACI